MNKKLSMLIILTFLLTGCAHKEEAKQTNEEQPIIFRIGAGAVKHRFDNKLYTATSERVPSDSIDKEIGETEVTSNRPVYKIKNVPVDNAIVVKVDDQYVKCVYSGEAN